MGTRRYTIVAPAPVGEVYSWFIEDSGNFPCVFNDKILTAKKEDGNLSWTITIPNKLITYIARITEQEQNAKIAWVSADGSPNRGELTFQEATYLETPDVLTARMANPQITVENLTTIITVAVEYDGPDSGHSFVVLTRFPVPRLS
jgi:uncharacterized membrane protein